MLPHTPLTLHWPQHNDPVLLVVFTNNLLYQRYVPPPHLALLPHTYIVWAGLTMSDIGPGLLLPNAYAAVSSFHWAYTA